MLPCFGADSRPLQDGCAVRAACAHQQSAQVQWLLFLQRGGR